MSANNRPRTTRSPAPFAALAIAVLAAIGLILAFVFLLPRAQDPGPSPVGPTPSATAVSASPSPSASPSASPRPAVNHNRVYFARNGLPPVSVAIPAPSPAGSADRARSILARLTALIGRPAPAGTTTLLNAQIRSVRTVSFEGDLATVDFEVLNGDWGVRGAAATQGLLQQLVYTATEEPGIRRVLITQNTGGIATIDQLRITNPLAREDVHGYVEQPQEVISSASTSVRAQSSITHSVDSVTPGLARVAIELLPVPGGQFPQGGYTPTLNAEIRANDEVARPSHGKYTLVLTVQEIVGTASTTIVDQSPLRAIHFTPGTDAQSTGRYEIALDDLRPWRLTLLSNPARIVVDVGGHPFGTALNTVVYAPKPSDPVTRDFMVSGLARAFEATVSWRVEDSNGQRVVGGFTNASVGTSAIWGTYEFRVQLPASVSGNVTLVVYQSSPRDGAEVNKVQLPLQVR